MVRYLSGASGEGAALPAGEVLRLGIECVHPHKEEAALALELCRRVRNAGQRSVR